MKRFLVFALCGLLMFDASAVLAKGSSGGGSRSSSFSSSKSSFSSSTASKPASSGSFFSKPAAPAAAPAATTTGSTFSKSASTAPAATPAGTQNSTFSAPSAQSAAKPVATANTALSNKMAKQDAVGAKAFSSKTDAESAFRQKEAAKYSNHFASEPKARPDYIPSSIDRGGSHYTVVYHGGCYGYYTGSVWTPLDMLTYMVVTDAMLNSNSAYGYGAYQQPVAYQQPIQQPVVYQTVPAQPISHPGRVFGIILCSILGIGLVLFLLFKLGVF
jgi:hypothetical protein